MQKYTYKILNGKHHVGSKRYVVGDKIELTLDEAEALKGRVEMLSSEHEKLMTTLQTGFGGGLFLVSRPEGFYVHDIRTNKPINTVPLDREVAEEMCK